MKIKEPLKFYLPELNSIQIASLRQYIAEKTYEAYDKGYNDCLEQHAINIETKVSNE